MIKYSLLKKVTYIAVICIYNILISYSGIAYPHTIVKDHWAKKPCYTYMGNESIVDMRKKTVKAMSDMLSVKWSPKSSFIYKKRSGDGYKIFGCVPGKIYAGLPYTNAGSALFQWLYYYDFTNGIIDGVDWKKVYYELGNSCASCVIWAVCATCNSIAVSNSATTYTMTNKNGWLPLGMYVYPDKLSSYNKKIDTDKIIKMNSKDAMFESYALIDVADVVVAASPITGVTAKHAMMAIDKAFVVRDKNRKIDENKSYIYIQEQSFSNYEEKENGQSVWYRGHLKRKYTFNKLLKSGYIPLTTSEFQGLLPFKKSQCEIKGNTNSIENLRQCFIKSNNRLAVLKCKIKTDNDALLIDKGYLINNKDISSSKASSFKISDLINDDIINKINDYRGNCYNVIINVTLSDGSDFELLNQKFTKKF